jgi:hypothetical protein
VANAATVLQTIVHDPDAAHRSGRLQPPSTPVTPKVRSQVVYNDVVLLPRRVVVGQADASAWSQTRQPLPDPAHKHTDIPHPEDRPFVRVLVPQTQTRRGALCTPGAHAAPQYINTPIPRVGYSLKLAGP